jgi:uncharacterized membrane protein YkvA (DUF1232 family)
MAEIDSKFLEPFASWLRSLGDDAETLAQLLADETIPARARESIAGALNYIFKSLDLIPDGIDDIGYLDDAFVLRVAADLALASDESGSVELPRTLAALARDSELVREFLGEDYVRLENYVKGLRKGAARGRSVADILGHPEVREEFLADVRGFAKSYEPPAFAREERTLIKLRAFLKAKLPK